MKLHFAVSAVVAALVAGCSGTATTTPSTGTPGEVETTGAAQVVKQDFKATRINYDSANDEMIIESIPFDDDVYSGRYSRDTTLDRGAYRAYVSVNGFDTYIAYFDESASGAVNGGVVGTDKYLQHGYRGAMYARTGGVTLPSSTRRAYYNGDYVGLRTNTDGGPIEAITGTSYLEVDFSDDTVRGGLRNRTVAYSTDPTVTTNPASGDVNFTDSQLNRTNGTYSGTLVQQNGVTGTYEGLLANGTGTASEAAGIVLIETGGFSENGTFIAIQ